MKVLKFGGSSIGTIASFNEVIQLVSDDKRKIVVLSAFSGTTNSLFQIADHISNNNLNLAKAELMALENKYLIHVSEIFSRQEFISKGTDLILSYFNLLKDYLSKPIGGKETKEIVSFGELISTKLFHLALAERGISSIWLNALDFVRINSMEEPDSSHLKNQLNSILKNCEDEKILITQGYICRNHLDEVDNLKRGGSDYTATLIGAAVSATEIQIWSDMDGLQNNDPRWVDKTFTLSEISYESASKLAYFGAKILHPLCILPAWKYNIPILLKNTFNPSAKGTIICKKTLNEESRAVSAKDKISLLKIRDRNGSDPAHILEDVKDIFNAKNLKIDLITADENEVVVLVESDCLDGHILKSLEEIGKIEITRSQTIVCVTGLKSSNSRDWDSFVNGLDGIPLKIKSNGKRGKIHLLVIDSEYKKEMLIRLNAILFNLTEIFDMNTIAA